MSKKGPQFERDMCVAFSKWWSEKVEGTPRDNIFWRTSGSGNRATIRSKQGKKTDTSWGDMTYIDEVGKPLIETTLFEFKIGYDIDILHFLTKQSRKGKLLEEWLIDLEKDRKSCNRALSILVYKKDYCPEVVFMGENLFFDSNIPADDTISLFSSYKFAYFGMTLKDFFTKAQPKYFIERYEHENIGNSLWAK